MSEAVGNRSYYDSTGQSDMAFTKPYSERTAQQIDDEVREIIDKAYAMAEQVLTEHREGMVRLAELLLEREVVFTEDVEHIFGKRKKDIEREKAEQAKLAAEQSVADAASESVVTEPSQTEPSQTEPSAEIEPEQSDAGNPLS